MLFIKPFLIHETVNKQHSEGGPHPKTFPSLSTPHMQRSSTWIASQQNVNADGFSICRDDAVFNVIH